MLQHFIQAFALTTPEESFGYRASTAGIVSLQGMLTIFLVLAILWAAIEVMHRIFAGKTEKPAAPKAESKPLADAAPAPNAQDAAVAAAIAAALAASEDDGALVAAITAAITAARAEEGCTSGFRVVSFKRAGARKR